MNKRLFLTVGVVCLLAGGLARAADFAQVIVSELKQQGYSRIETDTTWLGRVRIVAERTNGTREIILNPRTGEILRDLWILLEGTSGPGKESGILDRDYDDDGGSSDDNSGSGSDNSGSGSSGSGSDDSSGSGSSGSGGG